MRIIHKAALKLQESQSFIAADGIKCLAVQAQNGSFSLWYETDAAGSHNVHYVIRIVGTGHAVPSGASYIDTVQDGAFVWHFYLEQN
jgi:hypothetical protein